MLVKYNSLEKEFDSSDEQDKECIYSFIFPEHYDFTNIKRACYYYHVIDHETQMGGYAQHYVVEVAVVLSVIFYVRNAHP